MEEWYLTWALWKLAYVDDDEEPIAAHYPLAVLRKLDRWNTTYYQITYGDQYQGWYNSAMYDEALLLLSLPKESRFL